jgi:hypothetical protein
MSVEEAHGTGQAMGVFGDKRGEIKEARLYSDPQRRRGYSDPQLRASFSRHRVHSNHAPSAHSAAPQAG